MDVYVLVGGTATTYTSYVRGLQAGTGKTVYMVYAEQLRKTFPHLSSTSFVDEVLRHVDRPWMHDRIIVVQGIERACVKVLEQRVHTTLVDLSKDEPRPTLLPGMRSPALAARL